MAGTTCDPAIMQAYLDSLNNNNSATVDPIIGVYGNQIINFDHQVNYFDQGGASQYNINVENIQAAGTLYYNMVLADQLGVLRIADHVLMSWTSGRLDIPLGETATRLYKYYKKRNKRTSPEERHTLYRMVYNIGEGQTMDEMAVNKNFNPLWDSLMNEVVRYIQKTEKSDNPEVVSKSPIYQSISALQHNLSRSTAGIVKALVPEMYAHLEDALSILGAPQVVSQLGQGMYKDTWNVIERVSMDRDGVLPNVQAYRDIAVFAHKLFMAIADFSTTTFQEADFKNFIFNAESFIIAQGQLGDNDMNNYHSDDEDDEDVESEMEMMEEEWDF